jgi:hypothetical protein
LAIECEGDRELPVEKLRDDVDHQSMLQRLGWRFARVRGSMFFREPNRALRPVFEKLKSLDIPACSPGSSGTNGSHHFDELTRRVIRRADELRWEWSGRHEKRRLRAQPADSTT